MPFPHCRAALCSAFLITFAGCANTTFIGHKHAFNLETELKPDMSAPLNINFGYLSHSAVVVPPKNSLPLNKLADSQSVAKGDLLSTWSVFRVLRGATLGHLTVRTGVATGRAATNLSTTPITAISNEKRLSALSGGESAPPAAPSNLGARMNDIVFGDQE